VIKERRLGRGLEALLGRRPKPECEEPVAETALEATVVAPSAPPAESPVAWPETPLAPPAESTQPLGAETPSVAPPASVSPLGQMRIDIGLIESNPAQPRQDFDEAELESLAGSIAAHGLLQPVVVRKVDDRYQLVAGERRLRAAQKAGWKDVPVNVVEADDRVSVELAIVENLQRKDLNPLEKAASFQRYLDQFACTQEDLAGRLKIDRSTIANLIRLLELPEPVQESLRSGAITQGHARALLPLGEEREQVAFCERIQREKLNVRQTESLVQETIQAADAPTLGLVDRDGKTTPVRPRSEHLSSLEQELRSALGTKVNITHNAKGAGKMVIHFDSHDEFDRIRRYLLHAEGPEAQNRAG